LEIIKREPSRLEELTMDEARGRVLVIRDRRRAAKSNGVSSGKNGKRSRSGKTT
jgi:hypothetical protein